MTKRDKTLNGSIIKFKSIIKDLNSAKNYENYLRIFTNYLFIKNFHEERSYEFKTINELRKYFKLHANKQKYSNFMEKKFNFNGINYNDIEAFLMLYRNNKAATRNFLRSTLKKYFKFLFTEKLVKTIIITEENFKFEKTGKPNRNIPTEEQFLEMVEKAETFREKVMIQFAFGSTLRATEIALARIEDIIWDQNIILIYGAKMRDLTEASIYVFGNTTKKMLKKWVKHIDREEGFIFINPRTKKHYTREGIRYIIMKAGESVGIVITAHSSKDFNLNMFEKYQHPKLKDLMLQGKHQDKGTTLKYLRDSGIRELVEKIKRVPFF